MFDNVLDLFFIFYLKIPAKFKITFQKLVKNLVKDSKYKALTRFYTHFLFLIIDIPAKSQLTFQNYNKKFVKDSKYKALTRF